jgi:hypothetical protein
MEFWVTAVLLTINGLLLSILCFVLYSIFITEE